MVYSNGQWENRYANISYFMTDFRAHLIFVVVVYVLLHIVCVCVFGFYASLEAIRK